MPLARSHHITEDRGAQPPGPRRPAIGHAGSAIHGIHAHAHAHAHVVLRGACVVRGRGCWLLVLVLGAWCVVVTVVPRATPVATSSGVQRAACAPRTAQPPPRGGRRAGSPRPNPTEIRNAEMGAPRTTGHGPLPLGAQPGSR
jgi:hypothetical protein